MALTTEQREAVAAFIQWLGKDDNLLGLTMWDVYPDQWVLVNTDNAEFMAEIVATFEAGKLYDPTVSAQ